MVESSWIADISHDVADNTLLVEMDSGEIYKHSNVPTEVADDFEDAPSKGVYYNTMIRNSYECEKV